MVLQERSPVHAGDLRALIGMDQNLAFRLSAPHRHEQRLQHDTSGLAALQRPTDDAAGEQVDHHGQIGKALLGPDIGDVRHPHPVRRIDIKLPGKGVVDRGRRLAAIGAGPTLVAYLGLDPGQPGETSDAVGATGLSLIKEVVMQLAIALDPAAFLPGLAETCGLAHIFPGPFAQRVLQPGIETTGPDTQTAAHRPHRELLAMLSNKRVSHFASLAKYAVAFFKMSRSSVTRASSFFRRRISAA